MNKYIRNNAVGVVTCPQYGSGWSSFYPEYQEALAMDARIVSAVKENDIDHAVNIAKSICPHFYVPNDLVLHLTFVPIGEKFRIAEYDGREYVELLNELEHFVA